MMHKLNDLDLRRRVRFEQQQGLVLRIRLYLFICITSKDSDLGYVPAFGFFQKFL